jgi:hypothetical protein
VRSVGCIEYMCYLHDLHARLESDGVGDFIALSKSESIFSLHRGDPYVAFFTSETVQKHALALYICSRRVPASAHQSIAPSLVPVSLDSSIRRNRGKDGSASRINILP